MYSQHRADEEAEWLHRVGQLKRELSTALNAQGIDTFDRLPTDIEVRGPLSKIMEFCQYYRSEIEELG